MTDYFNIQMKDGEIEGMSSLGLAHLGDAVFELLTRAWLCKRGKSTSKGLHAAAVKYVSATAQARAADKFLPFLDDEEKAVYRRGRNARVNSIPGSASLTEYHAATALEAVFGYLYLKGRRERINQLFEIIMEEKAEGRENGI